MYNGSKVKLGGREINGYGYICSLTDIYIFSNEP